jgi:cell division septum initiation protein DivIVA
LQELLATKEEEAEELRQEIESLKRQIEQKTAPAASPVPAGEAKAG